MKVPCATRPLNPAQIAALHIIDNGYSIESIRATTVLSLARRGLIRWYRGDTREYWTLTDMGRQIIRKRQERAMSETFRYRREYPILDDRLTVSQVQTDAQECFVDDVTTRNMRIVSPAAPRLTESGTIVCEAMVQAMPGRKVAAMDRYDVAVMQLVQRGLSDQKIVANLGYVITRHTVWAIRESHGVWKRRKENADVLGM